MNNDLISKSTLLEELKEKVYPEKFGERCNAIDVIYAVLQVIEEQPTAYDVDKVVECLDGQSFIITDDDVIELYKAIEIVKVGGID